MVNELLEESVAMTFPSHPPLQFYSSPNDKKKNHMERCSRSKHRVLLASFELSGESAWTRKDSITG